MWGVERSLPKQCCIVTSHIWWRDTTISELQRKNRNTEIQNFEIQKYRVAKFKIQRYNKAAVFAKEMYVVISRASSTEVRNRKRTQNGLVVIHDCNAMRLIVIDCVGLCNMCRMCTEFTICVIIRGRILER